DTIVGDPVADGASVTISAHGGNPTEETYQLPSGVSMTTSKPFWKGDAVKGFKYTDSKGENGPVKTVVLKLKGGIFQIKVSVGGKLGPVGVRPPFPGTDGCALLTIVGGDSYSVLFAGGDVSNNGALLFKVNKPTSEGSCIETTTTTSTTTTSSTTTTLAIP